MAVRPIVRHFWVLEAILLVVAVLLVGEVLWQRSLQRQCTSEVLLITQWAQRYWQCTPKELELKYRNTLERIREAVDSLSDMLFWLEEPKVEEGAGIEFMRRVKQVESRLMSSFPQAELPNNLGFPTQMPSVEDIKYYTYYLEILDRVIPVILAKAGRVLEIRPVVNRIEGVYSLSIGFESDLSVLLGLFREVNSVPLINLVGLEVKPADEDREVLSVRAIFSPFLKDQILALAGDKESIDGQSRAD